MKIKRQFIILSTLIISFPILCTVFILIHTYIHSPNRYLIKGSVPHDKTELPLLSDNEIATLDTSLKLLPKDVEAVLYRTTDHKILYSTIPEIQPGTFMQKDEITSFVTETSDKYFYQFSKVPFKSKPITLITRLSIERINTEEKTRTYLKILFSVIVITIISLIIIFLISKAIFEGLSKIEHSSYQLAEGDLNKPVTTETESPRNNEFTNILISLEKMRCELTEMQKSKNHFITGISHDLRTPVAVIKGYSEAIDDDVISTPEEIKKTMELIQNKTAQLEDRIDTLINYVKLNDAEIKEKLIPQSITNLIQDFAKYVEITGKVFKRNVKTDIQFDKDIIIPFNNQLVHRSFENIMSNAIRYTKKNDLIEIYAHATESDSGNFITMQIKDSGSGINKKDLDYIFDMFYRGTNSRQEDGMGIGLSVVKSIMNTHGWNISVESEVDKGTCFTVTIPY